VFTGSAIGFCVTVSTGHIISSHNINFHINDIDLFTLLSSKFCLRFWNSGYSFLGLFLICYTCHNIIPSRYRYKQLSVYTFSSLAHGFPKFSITYFVYMFNAQNRLRLFPFQNKTLSVCRNVRNHLPSNVASYNRNY